MLAASATRVLAGRRFNAFVLDDDDKPHNPMINAGAIMSVSMVYPDLNRKKRLEKVLDFWRELSRGSSAGDNSPKALGVR